MQRFVKFYNERNIRIFLLAILFDTISRYLWTDNNTVYFLGQDLMVSTLLYLLILNTKEVTKTLISGFFALSIIQCIQEFVNLDGIILGCKEALMAIVLTITIIQINKQILNKKNK